MKNENHRALFDAVTDLDADLIEEAAEPRTIRFPKRIRRIAAIAAVIAILMTALLWTDANTNVSTEQNVLKVYACDISNTHGEKPDETTLLNGVNTVSWHCICDPGFNANPYLPFTFSFPESYFPGEEITFDIYADFDGFWCYTQTDNPNIMESIGMERFGKNTTISNNSTIFWECADSEKLAAVVGNQGFFYISIVIRANNQIVGYGLISLQLSTEPIRTAKTVDCITVCFPAVEGRKQAVSNGYVWQQIEALK